MSKSSMHKSICALLMLVMAFGSITTALAQAQAGSGQIAGTLTDSTGAAIAAATIKAKNKDTGLERSATTNEDGNFTIVLLPPGNYVVTAEASGFQSGTAEVEVTVGRTTDFKFKLGASGVSETINVSAGAVQVQTTRSEADAVLNLKAIENLPINGRRFQDFVTLTPTAQVDPSRGQISLSGQRGINSNINVDGVDYNQPFFGGIRGGERSNTAFTIPQESIKEFQVVASGYSAEFGRSTGGIVNAVTKSGTNEYHGSAFFLIRPKQWSRNTDFFDAVQEDLDATRAARGLEPIGLTPAPTQTQFGGSVGGPIKKDKLFFFAAYEQQEFENERQVFFDPLRIGGFSPNAASLEAYNYYLGQEDPFLQTNDAKSLLGRIDYEINSDHRFNIRYSYSKNEALNANSVGNQLFPTTVSALSNNGTELDETNTVVGQLASFFSASLVNELRGQFSREERPRLANAEQPLVTTGVGNVGTVSFLPNSQFDWRVQFADSLTWTKSNHTIKFGGEYNHVKIDQTFGFNQFGTFNITTSGANAAGVQTILDILAPGGTIANRLDAPAGAPTTVTLTRQIGNLRAAYSSDELAFFAQDSWRVRPNFTLNYGLRWEAQYNPEPEANNTFLINALKDFRFPSGHYLDPTQIPDVTNQWGPRLGFAWDPRSNGRTVVRGYTGIYYARTPLLLLAAPFNNFRDPGGDVSIQLPFSVSTLPTGDPRRNCTTVYCQLNLIGINLNNFTLDNLPIITPEQINQIAQALGLNPNPYFGASVIGISSDFKNPKSYQFGFGFEHEITRGLTVRADYSHVKTVYLQRNRELNLPLPRIRVDDIAQRPFYGLRTAPVTPRPLASLNSVQVRESTAKSLYRALVLGAKYQKTRFQFNVFYTLSKLLSDDDNERSSGGVAYEDAFNLVPEYYVAVLDRKHQFTVSPVINLPWGIDVSAAARLRSGRPIDAIMGNRSATDTDANEDRAGPDRPYSGPGTPFKRNAFRNRALYDFDARVQKSIGLGNDTRKLVLSMEFFNLFNLNNIELSGSQVTAYCSGIAPRDCGFSAPTNVNFLSLYENTPTSSRFGKLLLNNNPGVPFQVQFGARFMF